MQRFKNILLMGLAAGLLMSCEQPAGDAVAHVGPTIGKRRHDTLFLPEFPIGITFQHEYTIQHDIPTFPHELHYLTREEVGDWYYTPWDRSRVRVTVLTMDGKTIASKTVIPQSWRFVEPGHYQHYIWTNREARQTLPKLNDYKVRVEVLAVSRRKWDHGKIFVAPL